MLEYLLMCPVPMLVIYFSNRLIYENQSMSLVCLESPGNCRVVLSWVINLLDWDNHMRMSSLKMEIFDCFRLMDQWVL